jgi:hypothetical protein
MSNQLQDSEFQDHEPTIERCPHDKENPYVMVSRDLIRDNSLSPECRLMLIYLLSMDGKKWKINPKQLVLYFKPHWGRNKVYEWIDQAIEAGYMKKEVTANIKHPNLRGKIKYYVSESAKFKKCFRHPEIQDAEDGDPVNRDYKNNNHTSSDEEVLNKESSSSRKQSDDDLVFSDKEREDLNNYTPDQISQATLITNQNCFQSKNSVRVKYFFTTIKNLKEKPKNIKIPPFKELSNHFKNGELYNQAECNITEKAISFTRGMKYESVDFKYFSWENFTKLCESFGIKFKR